VNAWASTSTGRRLFCTECGREVPAYEEYYYVIEREDNLPVCWRHIERDNKAGRMERAVNARG
jgi:hypothetical protein